jgi:hypothetical protein
MGPLTKEIPQIDLKSVWDVIRLRWWIFPLTIAICVGLLFTQESDLQTTPSFVSVSRSYAPRNETARLAIFGIDTASIREYPTFRDQLIKVRRDADLEIATQFGNRIDFVITKTEPQVSLVTSQDNAGSPILTLRSASEPNYELTCLAVDEKTCSQFLDIVAENIITARVSGIASGMKQVADDLQRVLDQTNPIQPTLELQLNALRSAMKSLTGEIVLVGETVQAQSATVSSVKKSTYLFGAGLGFFVSILMIMQLTYTDDKIRSSRKLLSFASAPTFFGEITGRNTTAEVRQLLAVLVSQSRTANQPLISLTPVDTHTDIDQLMELMRDEAQSNGLTLTKVPSINEMSIAQMTNSASALTVIIARKNFSSLTAVRHTKEVLARSNNNVVGVVLVAPAR